VARVNAKCQLVPGQPQHSTDAVVTGNLKTRFTCHTAKVFEEVSGTSPLRRRARHSAECHRQQDGQTTL